MAISAIATASHTTTDGTEPRTIASTTRPASSGVDTASTDETTVSSRKTTSFARCGRAKASTRRNVPRRTLEGASEVAPIMKRQELYPSTLTRTAQRSDNSVARD
jgi:hypothetical protein